MPTISNVQDKLAIRELIENWAVWRDSFQWDRFRTVWHPEGRMWATWFQGTYEEFIAANLAGYAKGVRIYHFLGGTSIDIKGKRAIAQPKCRSLSAPWWKAWSATFSASAASMTSWKSAKASGVWCGAD
jgi:hypothetical protein